MGTADTLLISISAFLTALLLALGLPGVLSGPAVKFVQRWRMRTQQGLDDIFMRSVTATEAMGLVAAGTVGAPMIAFLLSGSVFLALAAGGVGLVAPQMLLAYLRRNRRIKLVEQLSAVLDQMVSSAKAGLTLVQIFEEVSHHMPAPASEEFRLMVQDSRLGKPLRQCIESERQRLSSRQFNLVASALSVHLEKGGNLPEALATISASLKEIWRLEQKLLTASAEGRKAVKVISGMPLVVFVMVIHPEIVEILTSSTIGWILMTISVAMYAFALWWLRKILTTDI
jgi:tight adherence protein B